MEVQYPITFDYIKAVSGELLKVKVVPIGDWNMDVTVNAVVAHGLGAKWENVRHIEGLIRDDGNTRRYPFPCGTNSDVPLAMQVWCWSINSTDIFLYRTTGGIFDGVQYDSVGYNRGWVMLWYYE